MWRFVRFRLIDRIISSKKNIKVIWEKSYAAPLLSWVCRVYEFVPMACFLVCWRWLLQIHAKNIPDAKKNDGRVTEPFDSSPHHSVRLNKICAAALHKSHHLDVSLSFFAQLPNCRRSPALMLHPVPIFLHAAYRLKEVRNSFYCIGVSCPLGRKVWINNTVWSMPAQKLWRPSLLTVRLFVIIVFDTCGWFYEWHAENGKQPYYIHRKDNVPLAFAGLWDHWDDGEGNPYRVLHDYRLCGK